MSSSHRLFRIPKPAWLSSPNLRTAGVYLSGALFAVGFFVFIDAAVFSKQQYTGDVHVRFVDWIPGICSLLGMLVVNSIEKARLSADSYSYSGTGVAWKARLVLFLGFALMAGGLAGSVVRNKLPQPDAEISSVASQIQEPLSANARSAGSRLHVCRLCWYSNTLSPTHLSQPSILASPM